MQMTLPVSTAAKRAPQSSQKNPRIDWGAAGLGAQEFLTLLVAELKNQDPFNPLDQREMLSQLAQLQTVAELRELNQKMGHDKGLNSELVGLIGKNVWWEDADGTVRSGRVRRIMQTPDGWQLMVANQFVDWARIRGVGE